MAAGETVIRFGQLTFFNVLTRHINQELMYDDSGTDQIGIRFTVAAMGHIHGLASAGLGTYPTTGDGDAANAIAQIQYLLFPRQHFEMRLGVRLDSFGNMLAAGTPVIYCDPANQLGSTNVSLCDISNGPKAKVLNVTRVSSDALLRVDLEFEICMLICSPTGRTDNQTGVLNNRWTVVDDIDENFYTTRTFTGKLRLSSAQVNPNNFRNLCVPPLQQGMRRGPMHFEIAEDSLSLLYSVTDHEVAFSAPAPATTWHASFGQSIETAGQLGRFYSANITLGGDRNCDLKKLIAVASAMIQSKFGNGLAAFKNATKYFITSIEVIEEYTDRGAYIHMQARARSVDTNQNAMFGLATKDLGTPINGTNFFPGLERYDNTRSRGTRNGEQLESSGPIPIVGAFAPFLQNGCGYNFGINLGIPAQPPPVPVPGGLPGITATTVTTSSIPDDGSITTVYGPGNDAGIYTWYKIQKTIKRDSGRAVMPLGSSQPNYFDPTSPNYVPGGGVGSGQISAGQPGSVVVTLSTDQNENEAIIDGERIGKEPLMPTPKDLPDGSVMILGQEDTVLYPAVTPEGKTMFRRRRRVWWWEAIPGGHSSTMGFIPFSSFETDENVVGGLQPPPPPYKPGTPLF